MAIDVLLYSRLAAYSGISALVGTRIYPKLLPQTPTLPALTYQRVSNTATNGSTVLRESRWQVTCWAATDTGARALATQVKTALEEHSDVSVTPGIKYSRIVNEIDDYEPETELHGVILDAMLTTTGD